MTTILFCLLVLATPFCSLTFYGLLVDRREQRKLRIERERAVRWREWCNEDGSLIKL